MRCPKCRFVSSDKKDICPSCRIDLRPYKHYLGLPISNPKASLTDLLRQMNGAEIRVEPRPPQSQPAESKPESNAKPRLAPATPTPIASKNAFGSTANANIISKLQTSSTPSARLTPPPHKPAIPIAEQIEEAPPLQFKGDFATNDMSFDVDAALSDESELFEISERPEALPLELPPAQHKRESGPSEKELDELFLTVNRAKSPEIQEPQAEAKPEVRPEVMEFQDEDEFLQKLDEMIGDTVLDISSVKVEKPRTRIEPHAIDSDDDDLEISFEFDLEGEQSENEESNDEPQSAPESDRNEAVVPRSAIDEGENPVAANEDAAADPEVIEDSEPDVLENLEELVSELYDPSDDSFEAALEEETLKSAEEAEGIDEPHPETDTQSAPFRNLDDLIAEIEADGCELNSSDANAVFPALVELIAQESVNRERPFGEAPSQVNQDLVVPDLNVSDAIDVPLLDTPLLIAEGALGEPAESIEVLTVEQSPQQDPASLPDEANPPMNAAELITESKSPDVSNRFGEETLVQSETPTFELFRSSEPLVREVEEPISRDTEPTTQDEELPDQYELEEILVSTEIPEFIAEFDFQTEDTLDNFSNQSDPEPEATPTPEQHVSIAPETDGMDESDKQFAAELEAVLQGFVAEAQIISENLSQTTDGSSASEVLNSPTNAPLEASPLESARECGARCEDGITPELPEECVTVEQTVEPLSTFPTERACSEPVEQLISKNIEQLSALHDSFTTRFEGITSTLTELYPETVDTLPTENDAPEQSLSVQQSYEVSVDGSMVRIEALEGRQGSDFLPINPQPITPIEVPLELWEVAAEEVRTSELGSEFRELEFRISDIMPIECSPVLDLLFEITHREIADPSEIVSDAEKAPLSLEREIDNSELKAVFTKNQRAIASMSAFELSHGPAVTRRTETPQEVDREFDFAPLPSRVVSTAIDLASSILLTVAIGVSTFIPGTLTAPLLHGNIPPLTPWLPVLPLLLATLLGTHITLTALLIFGRGQTIGQKTLELETIDWQAKPPNLAGAFLWSILQLLTPMTAGVACLVALGHNRTTLADILASVRVVRHEPSTIQTNATE